MLTRQSPTEPQLCSNNNHFIKSHPGYLRSRWKMAADAQASTYNIPNSLTPCSFCRYPCWTVDEVEGKSPEIVSSHQDVSFRTLKSSAQSGCVGCEVLKLAWEFGTLTPDTDDKKNEWFTFNWCSGDLYFHLFTNSGVKDLDIFTIEHDARFKHVRVASDVPLSTNLDFVLNRIRSWIFECDKQHKSCCTEATTTPPRLLDLELPASGTARIVDLSKDLAGK